MIIDPIWERAKSIEWLKITDKLKKANVDWSKWLIVPEDKGSKNVYKG